MENLEVRQRHRLSKAEEKELSEKIAQLYGDFDIKSIATILNVRVDLVKRIILDLLEADKICLQQPSKQLITENTKIGNIFPKYFSVNNLIAIKSDNVIIIRPLQPEDINY